ncbi:unnamed protein product [Rotaria sp. Silwood1]|nr:unnamed protein product [Rotaria sp. Silwood1]CAF0957451.1 unnamed protein product [Rotaria sp. Silwood1]CAF3341592.1 unnamed protein product [Rotaria sp. Silwood1]CAF4643249.1 unnamed protein product [Rotaria sp. Silwood1]
MRKKDYYKQQSCKYILDREEYNDPDDEYLIEFKTLLFDELLYNIRKVPFAGHINNHLLNDNATFYDCIRSNSLYWLYTADRRMIHDERVYSFRFCNPCHPDYYESFIIDKHPLFVPSQQHRHGLEGWYKYIGKELPKTIENYLNVANIMNETVSHETKIFVNNKYERLDIEFYFRHVYRKRLTITFEPGYPAVVV